LISVIKFNQYPDDVKKKLQFAIETRQIFDRTINTLPLTEEQAFKSFDLDPKYEPEKEITNMLVSHQ